MWEIKKIVKKGKYLYAVVPEHPKATKKGYVLEHRVVVENFLNRLLTVDEIVHHKDEDTHNNNIKNLEVMLRSDHTRLHQSTGRTYVTCICPVCATEFKIEKRNLPFRKIPKCSRKCNGVWSRKIQLGLI